MRVIVTLHDKTVVLTIDLNKTAAAGFQVFAERNGNSPKQFIGIGCEPNTFSEI